MGLICTPYLHDQPLWHHEGVGRIRLFAGGTVALSLPGPHNAAWGMVCEEPSGATEPRVEDLAWLVPRARVQWARGGFVHRMSWKTTAIRAAAIF